MKLLTKKINNKSGEDVKETKKTEIEIIKRPRICCTDLPQKDFDILKEEGYNLFKSTLGSTIKIPNNSRHDFSYINLDHLFPINFHEFDILILDLTNKIEKKYIPDEHNLRESSSNSILRLKCSYPTKVFDPRPLTCSFLMGYLKQIKNKKFLEIIFACNSYEVEYGKDQITENSTTNLQNEIHNIYDFWNYIPLSKSRTGKEVKVCKVRDDIFSLLTKHKSDLFYEQTFYHPETYDSENKNYYPNKNFFPLLKNIKDEIVSFAYITENKVTFVLPNLKNKSSFLSEFFKYIGPSLLPEIFPFSTQFKWKESPEYFLPNHLNLLHEKTQIEIELNNRIEAIDKKITENIDGFRFLHNMITETGDELVKSVCTFLEWLGFASVIDMDEAKSGSNNLEEDIQINFDEGLLVIECKGIGGTSSDSDCSQISKIKNRRCRERNEFDVYGLYIVNHERYLPPLKRKNPPFTAPQIQDAKDDKRGLVTTWQLFNLYFDIENKIISKENARKELLQYGLVNFAPKGLVFIDEPKEIFKNGTVCIVNIDNIPISVNDEILMEKNERFQVAKVKSIQIEDDSVQSTEKGEIGLELDKIIKKKTKLWKKAT